MELDYYKENEDEFSMRRVEPYALTNGQEGWYVASFDPGKQAMRHFRLDRIRRAHVTDEAFEPRPEVDPGPKWRAGCAPVRCRPRAPPALDLARAGTLGARAAACRMSSSTVRSSSS